MSEAQLKRQHSCTAGEGHAATRPELPASQQPGRDTQTLQTLGSASTQSPPPGSDALLQSALPSSAAADVAQDIGTGSQQRSQQQQEQVRTDKPASCSVSTTCSACLSQCLPVRR